ncbi:serine/threonine protein kinase [Aphanothece hegewaldii CCALA 016]|uniref:Serine/threonine protein kinase n=1 Tax=Aphanothece hegewaldii CCALA 016 TaxID=2107694 RepID=A0A2T1LS54_9CHRO|nr:AAA-like domain-containing protein [Aphanothece hegewaldii]PSF32265.1 serine/threonine protein kinase [Aphanothece hegewaldii CCALA 016]
MMQRQQDKQRRKRGVILTIQGLEKLLQAKTQSEIEDNLGSRYTLEALSEKTGLAVDTLMKVLACEEKVDKQTLKTCFRAFKLILDSKDYFFPEQPLEYKQMFSVGYAQQPEPEFPEGQISLDSPFYIERSTIEADCYKAIAQPGSLIRIKAPKRMGKSSLMMRILNDSAQKGYRTVSLNLQLAEKSVLQNLDTFLQWFCAYISAEMQLSIRLNEYWDDLCGSNISCKLYFEQYLLANTEQPIVIGLDEIDCLFLYPELADNFFALLRVWHEEAKNKVIWQKLRLVLVHSTEVYLPLNLNQSPFNVGLPIALPEFTLAQVQDLANRYQLFWSNYECEKLMQLVGGNPYLIHLAIYHIYCEQTNLEELFTIPFHSDHFIYKEHLQRQLCSLKRTSPDLLKTYAKVILAAQPIELDIIQAFKLQSLGLVRLHNTKVLQSCQLYAQYFREYFKEFSEAI